jgi:hypothetical protein
MKLMTYVPCETTKGPVFSMVRVLRDIKCIMKVFVEHVPFDQLPTYTAASMCTMGISAGIGG